MQGWALEGTTESPRLRTLLYRRDASILRIVARPGQGAERGAGELRATARRYADDVAIIGTLRVVRLDHLTASGTMRHITEFRTGEPDQPLALLVYSWYCPAWDARFDAVAQISDSPTYAYTADIRRLVLAVPCP